MAVGEKRLREIALELAKHMGPALKPAAKLSIIRSAPVPTRMDAVLRESHVRRIRHLAKSYSLTWLVDQETFNAGSVLDLDDSALGRLLSKVERARECMVDGISFEDAGLVRSVDGHPGWGSDRRSEHQSELATASAAREKATEIYWQTTSQGDDSPF